MPRPLSDACTLRTILLRSASGTTSTLTVSLPVRSFSSASIFCSVAVSSTSTGSSSTLSLSASAANCCANSLRVSTVHPSFLAARSCAFSNSWSYSSCVASIASSTSPFSLRIKIVAGCSSIDVSYSRSEESSPNASNT